jgi:conjugal transfer pilus assembly protein TraI
MLGTLRNLFSDTPRKAGPATPAAVLPEPCYPPKTPEFLAIPPQELLRGLHQQVHALAEQLPLTADQVNALLQPALLRFASWVHLLPASASHHHSLPGGLLYHSIQVASWSAQRFKGDRPLLDDRSPSRQRHLTDRWTVACALAGLLHDIGKPLVDIEVRTEGAGVWPSHVDSLWDWLERQKAARYTIAWRPGQRHGRHEPFGATVAREIIGRDLLAYLSEHEGHDCINALLATLTNTPGPQNLISPKVTQADSDSTAADRKRVRHHLLAAGQGSQLGLAQQMLSAIAAKVQDGEWPINANGGLLFTAEGTLWGAYPRLLQEAAALARDQGVDYVPTDPSQLLEQMVETGLVESGENSLCRRMVFATPDGSAELSMTVFRFASAELVLGRQPLPETDIGAIRDTPGFKARGTAADPAAPAEEAAPAAPAAPAGAPTPAPPATASGAEIVIDDRRNRRDLSEAASNELADRYQTADAAELLEALDRQGIEGQVLAMLLTQLRDGALAWGRQAADRQGHLALRWPGPLAGQGVPPIELLGLFAKRSWLQTDESTQTKLLTADYVDERGAKAAVFTGLPQRIYERLRDEVPDRFRAAPADAKPAKPDPAPAQPAAAAPAPAAPHPPTAVTPKAAAAAPAPAATAPPPPPGKPAPLPVAPEALAKLQGTEPTPQEQLKIRSNTDVTPTVAEGVKGHLYRRLLQLARCGNQDTPADLSEEQLRVVIRQFITDVDARPIPTGFACIKGQNPLLLSNDTRQIHLQRIADLRLNPDYLPPTWATRA